MPGIVRIPSYTGRKVWSPFGQGDLMAYREWRRSRALSRATLAQEYYSSDPYFQDHFKSYALNATQWLVSGGADVPLIVTSIAGSSGVARFSSTGSVSCLDFNNNNIVAISQNPIFEIRAAISNVATRLRMQMGLKNGNAGAEVTANYIMFQNNPAAAAVDWFAISNDGATNSQDTTLLADTSFHRFKFMCKSGGSVEFYIDDVLKVVSVANVPTGTLQPHISCFLTSGAPAANYLHVDYVAVWADAA